MRRSQGSASTVTLRPKTLQQITWADQARFMNRSVPGYVTFAADWMARYMRELRRSRRPDRVASRLEEKRRLGLLLRAARLAVDYLPKVVDNPIRGRLDVRGDLRSAVRLVDEWLAEHLEEWE